MFTSFLVTLAISLSPASPDVAPKSAAKAVNLFAKERWYKSQKGKEQSFIGILHQIKRRPGVVGL